MVAPNLALRVVQIAASVGPNEGGSSTAALSLNRALMRAGHEAMLFATDADGAGRMRTSLENPVYYGGGYVNFYNLQRPRRWRMSRQMLLPILKAIRAADIVHLHGIYQFPTHVGPLIARLFNKPFVLQPHGILEPYQQAQDVTIKRLAAVFGAESAIKHADRVLFATPSEMQGALGRVSETRARLLPLGAELMPSDLDPEACSWWSPSLRTGRRLLFLGRIAAKKRLDVAVAAHAALRARGVHVHLLIAGPDTEQLAAGLQRLIQPRDRPFVHWLGVITGAEKTTLLRSADIFVLPSENENFGIAVAEALLAGLPVAISQGVALASVVESHELGIVIDHPDGEVLADAISNLLTRDLTAMRENAHSYAAANYQWSTVAERAVAIYRDVLQAR